ncbi:MAG: hypothetical protein K2W94_05860 [Alphaproteobacteria bacterium]|nr:hypothetical protein [Alphaproteobacteria bacterium]
MKIIRLIAISLLLCISHAIGGTVPEGMQALDPQTQNSLKLYMSIKNAQGEAYIKGMLQVSKDSPNKCLRYLAAKSLEGKTGSDSFAIKSRELGKAQLKAIFTTLSENTDKFTKDCRELKSAFGENVINDIGDPYSDFIHDEINPFFEKSHRIHIKIKAAEHGHDPQQLIDLLQDPYINDDNRQQILDILKTKYSYLPDVIKKGLLAVFQTAVTLSLKESCLNQLFAPPLNILWYQSGLEIIEKETRAKNPQFCPILERAKIPSEWADLEKMKIRLIHECKVFNTTLSPHERIDSAMQIIAK